jgi:hypothetical protein
MKKMLLALAVAGVLVPAPVHAQSALSMNHFVTDDMPHEDCMAKARRVMRAARLQMLSPTSETIWAETSNRNTLAAIYCLKSRDIALFAVAGRRLDDTRPVLNRMVDAWRDDN